jgi:hypothetical protein
MGNELASLSPPRPQNPTPSSASPQSPISSSTSKMTNPPTRTQPSRPSKRKVFYQPCVKCIDTHDPAEPCEFNGKVDENSTSELEIIEDGVDDEMMDSAPPAKKAKRNLVRGGGNKKGKSVQNEKEYSCICERNNRHMTEAECEREQLRKNHVEVGFW